MSKTESLGKTFSFFSKGGEFGVKVERLLGSKLRVNFLKVKTWGEVGNVGHATITRHPG